jgi:hypothetical protein
MFKVSPAIHQTFTDTPNCVLDDRVQYGTVHIPNVFCDDRQVHRDCLITLYNMGSQMQDLTPHAHFHEFSPSVTRDVRHTFIIN